MSAAVLREAASLMRERAEAATTGPWAVYTDEHDDPIVFDQYGMGVQSSATYDVITYAGQIYTRDALHIASWHPVVALAVADWLDFEARVHDADEWSGHERSLAVARAYLGESA